MDRRVIAACLAGLLLTPLAAYADDAKPAAPAAAAASSAAPAAPAATTPAAPAAAAAPAVAQIPDAVQAWAKFCDPDPKDGHKICIVRKLVFQNGGIIGSFLLRLDSKKGVPTLAVAAVPVGVVLRPGLRWQLDNAKAITLPYWRCTPQSCESEQLLRPGVVNLLRKAKTVTLTAKDINNKDFPIKVSMQGFVAAYDSQNAPTFADYSKSLPKQ